jgi:hypothetical protein
MQAYGTVLWLPLVWMVTCGIGAIFDTLNPKLAYLYTLNPIQAYSAVATVGLDSNIW